MEITLRIGGEAGQGLQFIGSCLAKILARSGFHVFTHQDYMSRIRGGHNFYQIRFADEPVYASYENIDILLALDAKTISIHSSFVKENGLILYDSAMLRQEFSESNYLNVPFLSITEEAGVADIMANSAAIGAILGGLVIDLQLFADTIELFIGKKGKEVIASNVQVARKGEEYIHRQGGWPDHLKTEGSKDERLLLLNGNQAIGFGAVASGCKFYAAYPMTPSTSIMNYIAGKAKQYGLIVEQAEDEIAAINMILGASFGGVRAMTGTSGGGFALMAEGLSLAGMTELPVVIAEVQRPGPATGLPTRTEQGDLSFVLYCGHGEFPRVIFTPGTPEQAVMLTNKAFELAEKYQIPAIIQSDQYLADSEWTYHKIDTGALVHNEYRLSLNDRKGSKPYKRYALTQDGISPLAIPGLSTNLVVVDSDEHNEDGHIIEDAETRIKMVEKRLLIKKERLRKEISPPLLYGHQEPRVVLAGYGSTYGVMRETVDRLTNDVAIAMLHFSEIWPFPGADVFDFVSLLQKADLALCIENNATGQFAKLIRGETGFAFTASIRKYDGRPFLLEPFIGEVNEHIRGL